MNTAIIFDIQRGSFADGPGIRTTVFFKGCNLKCIWCHNPESQKPEPQVLYNRSRCTGCGRCKNISAYDKNFICLNNAKSVCGKAFNTDEIFREILKDRNYYENSSGGVTFSGGECMLQIDFLEELLIKCKSGNIHTAVDTAGNVPWKSFERILPYTDLFLYDIKLIEPEKHLKYTGSENGLIINNLKKLFKCGANIQIRIPVIPGINDSVTEAKKIRDFLKDYMPSKIELLPYHKTGEHKYTELSITPPAFDVPDKNTLTELKKIFNL